MVHSEVDQHVHAGVAVAEGMIIFGYRTDSIEALVAGFRDTSGWEPLPSQIAKASVATLLLSRPTTHVG